MAERNFKIGEAIEVIYQAAGSESGITINMEVYDESHTIVEGGPIVMTEIGNSGRYYAEFVPDASGEWSVQIEKSDGTGKLTKAFSVGDWNVHSLGAKVVVLAGKADDRDVNLGVVHTKVDDLKTEAAARGTKLDNMKADTDRLGSIETNVDEITNSLPDIKSPPLIG